MSKPVEPELPGPDLPDGVHKSHPFNIQHGAHKEHPWMHGRHDLHAPISDGHDESSVQIYPSQVEGIRGRHIHPFELQAYTVGEEDATEERPEGTVVLRCYYGELFYSICSIATEGIQVVDTSTVTHNIFPISAQAEIPGIDTVVPKDFTFQAVDDQGADVGPQVMLSYTEWAGSEVMQINDKGRNVDNDPDEEDQPFGSVYLKWTANETSVPSAQLVLRREDEDPEQNNNISNLKKTGTALQRAQTKGQYYFLIGEHRDVGLEENEGASPIEQKVFDNVYWAVTIVKGSNATGGSPPTTTYEDSHDHVVGPDITPPIVIGGPVFSGPNTGVPGVGDAPPGGVPLGGLVGGGQAELQKGGINRAGVADQPPGGIKGGASPIQDQLRKAGLNPNSKQQADVFKMRKSMFKTTTDPDYEDTD